MYEEASGQAISLPKSEIFYSRNVQQQTQNSITNILAVQAVLGTGKYLGLPSMVGRSKKATFSFIKDRVWQRINSWSSKCLSKAGREVMIKSVLQSMPSYVMSIFRLPNNLLDEIEKMMNAFWWDHGGANNKGMHWLSWDKLSVHKNHGGMGFKDLAAFNVAMLGKQGWKFQTEPDTLVAKVFKAKYFPHSNYLGSRLGHNPSFVWRSIFSAKVVVRHGTRWSIGDGFGIPIIGDPWIGTGLSIPVTSPVATQLQRYSVGHLIHQGTKMWNEEVVRSIFEAETAQQILDKPLFPQVNVNRSVWKAKKNGHYSVRSAYRLCMEEIVDNSHMRKEEFWCGIWKLKIPPKIKNMVWRVCCECLPTQVRLNRRGVNCPSSCVLCNDPHEDSYHMFFHCGTAVGVWRTAGLWHLIEPLLQRYDDAPEIIFHLLENSVQVQAELFATLLWSIWKSRNLRLWQNVNETNSNIVARAKHLIEDWRFANRKQLMRESQQQNTAAVTLSYAQQGTVSRPGVCRWQRPAHGRFMCNIDASFLVSTNKLGLGMCIRDEEGCFVLAKTMWFSPVCLVDIGEALGLYHAVRWVHD